MQIVFMILTILGSLAIMVGFYLAFKGFLTHFHNFADEHFKANILIIVGWALIVFGILSIYGVTEHQKTLRKDELYAKMNSDGYSLKHFEERSNI